MIDKSLLTAKQIYKIYKNTGSIEKTRTFLLENHGIKMSRNKISNVLTGCTEYQRTKNSIHRIKIIENDIHRELLSSKHKPKKHSMLLFRSICSLLDSICDSNDIELNHLINNIISEYGNKINSGNSSFTNRIHFEITYESKLIINKIISELGCSYDDVLFNAIMLWYKDKRR